MAVLRRLVRHVEELVMKLLERASAPTATCLMDRGRVSRPGRADATHGLASSQSAGKQTVKAVPNTLIWGCQPDTCWAPGHQMGG